MKRQFIVKVEMPEEVKGPRMADYIKEAVQSWKGNLSPDDPLYDLDPESVKVLIIPRL